MPGYLYTVPGTNTTCPHGGMVQAISKNANVTVMGQPVATITDVFTVTGCAFTIPGPKPQPCVLVKWLVPSARILVNGQPVVLQTSGGICQSAEQAPQGPPLITATQTRVLGM